jgi:hypothetical protein
MLHAIQCVDAQGQEFLSYAKVPASGARLTLTPWKMITTDQCVSFKVTGKQASGQTEYTVLDRHRVTAQELTLGIGADGKVTVPKVFLNSLERNQKFSLKAYVTFGAGAVCPQPGVLPNFPVSEYILTN